MKDEAHTFWEKQSENYTTAFEKIPELAKYLEKAERRHLFRVIDILPEMQVLDLGCGTGRWAFEFANKCESVVAVDFAEGMIQRAREEAEQREFHNIEFQVAPVQLFQTSQKFDLIILSGVLVYFNDQALQPVLRHVKSLLAPGGKIISRETVAIHRRLEIENEVHDKIGDKYSAIYRLPHEYQQFFADAGMKLIYANDFTPTNFPMILYRRFVPQRLKNMLLFRKFLQAGLWLQYLLDPFLLRHKGLYQPVMHRFWKVKSMLFVYGIDS